jgi:hypothetical protein
MSHKAPQPIADGPLAVECARAILMSEIAAMEGRLVAYFLVSLKPVTVKFSVSCLFPVERIEIESQFSYPNSTRYQGADI